jgi:tRNA threonylcarbamoyladenosine biosynthesis protein TsaB
MFSETPDAAFTEAGRGAPVAPMHARLLAFDTSTETMTVALQSATRQLTWTGEGGAKASARLIPQIRDMLGEAGLEFQQLQAIAFGRGPGAFTGLRTACAVAQGLAFGAALPVLPLDSLLIVAEGARVQCGAGPSRAEAFAIDVAMDARMGEVYAGAYRWAQGRWLVLSAPALLTLAALNLRWAEAPPARVAGSALTAFGDQLHCGDAQRQPHDPQRAAALLRLAQQSWHDGCAVDAALALPLYLRDKVALTVVEREALRNAGAGA